jgi:hypothetical protein
MWQKSLGGSDDDSAHSIQETMDRGFIVAGRSRSDDGDVSENPGYSHLWIVKLKPIVPTLAIIKPPTGPMGWRKPWGQEVFLLTGQCNPKSGVYKVKSPVNCGDDIGLITCILANILNDTSSCGEDTGFTAASFENKLEDNVSSENDPKYSIDFIPKNFDSYDPKTNPIYIYAPADGTIESVNLDPTCLGTCTAGNGTLGNHIIVKTYDEEMYLLSRMDSFNPDREFTVNHKENLGKVSSLVSQGEFIGILGNTAGLKSESKETSYFDVPHLHFEILSRSYKSKIGLFGIEKNKFHEGMEIKGDL